MPDALFEVAPLLQEACQKMFETRGIALQPVADERPREAPPPTDAKMYYVVLGLAGEHVKGSLVLEAPRGLLLESYRSKVADVSHSSLLDWAGEISNQVLGRVKNRCAPAGVDFSLGIPTVVTGTEVSLYSPQVENRAVIWFRHGQYLLGASLELHLSPTLLEVGAVPSEVLSEGEMLVF